MKTLIATTLAATLFAAQSPVLAQPQPLEVPDRPVIADPRVNTPGRILIADPNTLTVQGRDYLVRTMRDHMTRRPVQSPSRADLAGAGLSPQNDAIERAFQANGRWTAPLHVGVARPGTQSPLAIDPSVVAGARAAASRRVGREPTAAEVASDVAAFDARVARVNQVLDQRHADIAAAYKQTGRFPRDIEPPILGIAPRAAEAVNPTAESRVGLQRLFAWLLNDLAVSAPLPPPIPR